MRRVALILLALGLLTSFAPATPSITQTCAPIFEGPSTPSGEPGQHYWDPIVFPGDPGYPVSRGPDTPFHGPAHWHNFAGARGLNEDSVADQASMLEGTSSCSNPLDRSAYWVPSLIVMAGTTENYRVGPSLFTVTLRGRGSLPPVGLALISHDSSWSCGPGTPRTGYPRLCADHTARARIVFPRPDGIARLVLHVTFDLRHVRDPLPLSVGGVPFPERHVDYPLHLEDPATMHGDVIFGWMEDPRWT